MGHVKSYPAFCGSFTVRGPVNGYASVSLRDHTAVRCFEALVLGRIVTC